MDIIRARKRRPEVCQNCIRLRAEIERLKEERRELENSYLEELQQDHLTGICNRRGFDELLAKEVVNASRHHKPLCVVICDIDYFKKINDTYGHPVGDMVLKEVANLLSGGCRATDDVARIGGEEFGIILRYTDKDGAFKLIDRIRMSIENELAINGADGMLAECTMSFGLGQLQPNETIEGLMTRVDKALYAAKHEGRNKVVVS